MEIQELQFNYFSLTYFKYAFYVNGMDKMCILT